MYTEATYLPNFSYAFLLVKQWNLSEADTFMANIFVRFKQMSAFDRLCLWDFEQ